MNAKSFFAVLIAAQSICLIAFCGNIVPIKGYQNVVISSKLNEIPFYLSDSPSNLVVSLEVAETLPIGSEFIVEYTAVDAFSNLWCWGTANIAEERSGYTVYLEPEKGWVNLTEQLSFLNGLSAHLKKMQQAMEDEKIQRSEKDAIEKAKWKDDHSNLGVTYLAYVNIEIGADELDVWEIIGQMGKDVSQVRNMRVCEYVESNKIIRIVYDQGKVFSKAQSGL